MRPLPTPSTLKRQYHASRQHCSFVEESRQTVRNILNGSDSRLLLIVGPCSIHDAASAKEYAHCLAQLREKVSSQFFILMRTYFEKPRTLTGWKGMIYDPTLDNSHDIATGLALARQLLIELADREIPTATEFLDPLVKPYLEDLISWGSIGARTTTSQIHRQMASALPMPVGVKNPITGTLDAAIQGVIAATQPHTLMSIDEEGKGTIVRTQGNADAHLVLRGWDKQPNYEASSVLETLEKLKDARLPPRLLIDCSHDNSGKKYERQPVVFQAIIDQILDGNSSIRGILLESHLLAGSQTLLDGIKNLAYGVSVTDSCLDWQTTELLILNEAERLQSLSKSRQEAVAQ